MEKKTRRTGFKVVSRKNEKGVRNKKPPNVVEKSAREEGRAPPVARDTQRNAGRNRGRIRAQNLKERPNYRAPKVGIRVRMH